MAILSWVVPWLIAGGVMWLVAYHMAPVGREIPFSHGLIAVIIMGLCGAAATFYLKPIVGHWHILAGFIAHGMVVKAMFRLSFGRSIVTVGVYWLVMLLAGVAITLMARNGRMSL